MIELPEGMRGVFIRTVDWNVVVFLGLPSRLCLGVRQAQDESRVHFGKNAGCGIERVPLAETVRQGVVWFRLQLAANA